VVHIFAPVSFYDKKKFFLLLKVVLGI